MLVLDASIALAWGLPDESTEHAQSVLAEVNSTGARVPSLWIIEVLNGVLMAERRKRLTAQEGERFLSTLATLHRRRKIQIAETQPARAFARVGPLARDHRLTAYDATYLLLAQRAALPLATTDRALVSAAAEAGVKIWSAPRR